MSTTEPRTDAAAEPLPQPGDEDVPEVARAAFLAEFDAQNAMGRAKYGQGLRTATGRDAGRDALQEFADGINYLGQLRMEHDKLKRLAWAVVDAWAEGVDDATMSAKVAAMEAYLDRLPVPDEA